MNLIQLSLIFSFLISCATVPFAQMDKSKWKVIEMRASEDEALKLIGQKHNFITMTYEQFFDPLFKSIKWTSNCLEHNLIGKIRNEDSFILLHSIIFTGPDYRPGFCPEHEGAKKTSFVMLYCKKTNMLLQVSCLYEDCGKVFWDKQC